MSTARDRLGKLSVAGDASDPLDWTHVGKRLAERSALPPGTDSEGVFAGRFRVVRLIARGGMGAVWEARDLAALDPALEQVALKVMTPEKYAFGGAARFRREASIASALDAVYFPSVVAFDVHCPVPYIAFELLEGEPLANQLHDRGSFSVGECSRILRDVCSGLAVAHSFGVVHRDIHPRNLLLMREGEGLPRVRILDFGIAKPTSQESKLTEPGMLIGCAHYMSPEQVRSGRAVGEQSDFWSIGAILYRCLLGRLPFPGALGEVLVAIAKHEPPRPSSFAPVGPVVDEFFRIALHKDASRRFCDGKAMVQAFEDATAGLLTSALVHGVSGDREDDTETTVCTDPDYDELAASATAEAANEGEDQTPRVPARFGSGVRLTARGAGAGAPRPVAHSLPTATVRRRARFSHQSGASYTPVQVPQETSERPSQAVGSRNLPSFPEPDAAPTASVSAIKLLLLALIVAVLATLGIEGSRESRGEEPTRMAAPHGE
jgi:serine/threonine protein kinase